MERCLMTEEFVTKSIMFYLIEHGWEIISFDFPQSGTGIMIHPNESSNYKNRESIIPDIVAVKEDRCLFFENKDHFSIRDFLKINFLRTSDKYSNGIFRLLEGHTVSLILYGIGIPTEKFRGKAIKNASLVDFLVGVKQDGNVSLLINNSACEEAIL